MGIVCVLGKKTCSQGLIFAVYFESYYFRHMNYFCRYLFRRFKAGREDRHINSLQTLRNLQYDQTGITGRYKDVCDVNMINNALNYKIGSPERD